MLYQLCPKNSSTIHFAKYKMNLCLQYSTLLLSGVAPEGLGNALSKLNLHSAPTLHFFQNGKKISEVIGADVQRLKDIMEELYK
ncbi:hypothetical protein RND71_033857 [Anisodus tanguticus]|uniref:Thioredoxin domain-containing protein n=1 Tax=Anisodus tanguticus TaxID=243964 RepID=A0AAE1R9I8_9SOLA|nr:hypothetical protein RND71_033857 [Anisodus tanguticus]